MSYAYKEATPAILSPRSTSRTKKQGLSIGCYLVLLLENRKFVLSIILLLLGVTGLYLILVPPTYKAHALVRMDKNQVALPTSLRTGINASDVETKTTRIQRELAILRARSILGRVVEDLNLMIEYSPRYFPLIGEAIARKHPKLEGVAKPWWGFGAWAWGGEKLKIARFDVPDRYLNKEFSLVALQEGQFQLLGPKGNVLTGGVVGEVISADIGESKPLFIQLTELVAHPGTEFELTRSTSLAAIERLRMAFSLQQFSNDSNILRVELKGSNPEQLAQSVNDIAVSYAHAAANWQATEVGSLSKSSSVEFASIPEKPYWPQPSVLLPISVLLGFCIAAVLVFFRHCLQQLNFPNLCRNELSLPFVSLIDSARKCDTGLLPNDDPRINSLGPLLGLRAKLETTLDVDKCKVIMVCSPARGLGKSFISLKLAALLASSKKRVLIIDAGMQNGGLCESEAIGTPPGIADLLAGKASLGEAIVSLPDGVDLISRGSMKLNLLELLMHGALADTLEQLKIFYNHIVIAAPPILESAAAVIVGKHSDATFLALKEGHYSDQVLESSCRHVQQAGVKLNGFIINDSQEGMAYYPYRGYAYPHSALEVKSPPVRMTGFQNVAKWLHKQPEVECLPHIEKVGSLEGTVQV